MGGALQSVWESLDPRGPAAVHPQTSRCLEGSFFPGSSQASFHKPVSGSVPANRTLVRWQGDPESLPGGAAAGRLAGAQEKGEEQAAPRGHASGRKGHPSMGGASSQNTNHPVCDALCPWAEQAKDWGQVSCPQRAVTKGGRHRITPAPCTPTFPSMQTGADGGVPVGRKMTGG